jgi:hypothetical protein
MTIGLLAVVNQEVLLLNPVYSIFSQDSTKARRVKRPFSSLQESLPVSQI